jgi:uncharacterized protein (DUF697 family)
MAEVKKGWLRLKVEDAIRRGLTDAYETVKVDPGRFLMQLRVAYGVPVSSFQGMFSAPVEQLDSVAADVVRASMKIAVAEGAGLGLGGVLTIVPDLGILAAITMRMIQKLSLVYGFEFNTEDEIAELWVAAASAAGVDIGRELAEKELINRFVPRVIQRIAVQASGDIVEKWAGRVIPVLSSVIGAGLNYYFVRAWGERAISHFRQKHMLVREKTKVIEGIPALPES